ncbi:MAG: aspartate dehydrogenase [Candidatus Methanospirareceae archaeon]
MVIRVGVVGCGAIGSEICKAIDEDREGLRAELKFLIDRHAERLEELYKKLRKKPHMIGYGSENIEKFLEDIDLLIECASQSAVKEFVPIALKKGKDVMILSVGALADEKFFEEIRKIAEEKNCKLYIPSGAIIGVDGLKSASIGSLRYVRLTTRKNPISFSKNKYVEEKGIDLASLKEEKVLFEGSAEEAVKYFPENINVAETISIAGIGTKNTKVKIIADPSIKENVHEIEAEGEFGKFFMRIENIHSPANPKTSYLAALSAIATLKNISNPLKIGT